MLPGRQRAQGPLVVHGVDQRDVDGIHLTVFEDRVIRLGDPGERMLGAELARAIRVSARDRYEPTVARSRNAWDDGAVRDSRPAQDPPPDALGYMSTSS